MEKAENSRRIGEIEASEMQCVPHSESMQSIRRTRTPPSQKPGLHNTVSAVGAEFVSPGREAWENSFKGRGPEGRDMGHSYCTNSVHCVFSTKDRRESIPNEIQEKLWAYIRGIADNEQVPLLAIGGTNNHVHLLIALPASVSLSEAISKIKSNSSRWLSEHGIYVRVAGGLRSIQRWGITAPDAEELHSQSGKASSEERF